MATKNFTNFEPRTLETLNDNDFLVGYKSDESTEIKTSIRTVNYTPYVEVTRLVTGGQQRINQTEYFLDWDTKTSETNPAILFGDQTNFNIVLNRTGFYELDARYGAHGLTNGTYFLLKLRGSNAPIINFSSDPIEILDSRDPGVYAPADGTATTQGRALVRVTVVPYYLAVSYIADGGNAYGGLGYNTVTNPAIGNLPRIRARRLSPL